MHPLMGGWRAKGGKAVGRLNEDCLPQIALSRCSGPNLSAPRWNSDKRSSECANAGALSFVLMCAHETGSSGEQVEEDTGSPKKRGLMLILDSCFSSLWAYEPFPLLSGDNAACISMTF